MMKGAHPAYALLVFAYVDSVTVMGVARAGVHL